jgi:hypothetical protein
VAAPFLQARGGAPDRSHGAAAAHAREDRELLARGHQKSTDPAAVLWMMGLDAEYGREPS